MVYQSDNHKYLSRDLVLIDVIITLLLFASLNGCFIRKFRSKLNSFFLVLYVTIDFTITIALFLLTQKKKQFVVATFLCCPADYLQHFFSVPVRVRVCASACEQDRESKMWRKKRESVSVMEKE